MRSLWLLLVTGCAALQPSPHTPTGAAAPASPGPAVALRPAPLDEATVKAKSHALFDALDRHDLAAFQSMVGPSFVMFEQSRFYDAAWLGKRIEARVERHAPVQSRACKDERVFLGGGVGIYIGDCVENIPAEGDRPGAEYDGWHTVVWSHDGERWKVAHWGWQKAGLDAEREKWNDVFKKAIGFKLTANQLLIDTVKGKKPGTALDLAMGQGRNAVYLATKGWKVTGVDISEEGIKIASEAATKQKVKLEAVNQELEKYDLGTERWDLVTLIYAGDEAATIERIKRSIKKGGLVVVEFFAKEATAGTGVGGFEAGQLAKQFAGWKILRDEQVEDVADWSLRKTKLARFVAQKP